MWICSFEQDREQVGLILLDCLVMSNLCSVVKLMWS